MGENSTVGALNDLAYVANALNPKCPPTDIGHLQGRVWRATQALRDLLYGPNDGTWPMTDDRAPQGQSRDIVELRQLAYEHRNDGMELTAAMLDRCADRLAALSEQREPTPESLREVASWFDHPGNPLVVVEALRPGTFTAGQLLRRIAAEFARTHQSPEEGDDA